ncbi:putative reverse transcriptase domain-containing protein, partial [Tanacetum coccineum]
MLDLFPTATITLNTQRAPVGSQSGIVCYECGKPGHFRKDCPKLRNQNRGNKTRNKNGNKTGNQTRSNEATEKAYVIGGGGANPDSNDVTGTFLLNNCYASMLFDSGADRSFVSSTFSALLDVAPSTLDTSYAVELADGRILETNVVLRGCTLGLLGHSFDIDLMPVELVIMEQLVKLRKRRAFWSLNGDILKNYCSEDQYAVSIKKDMVYPCLHSPKTTKVMNINTSYPEDSIHCIQDMESIQYHGRYQMWSLLQEIPNTS